MALDLLYLVDFEWIYDDHWGENYDTVPSKKHETNVHFLALSRLVFFCFSGRRFESIKLNMLIT